jgi:hypothetical protein
MGQQTAQPLPSNRWADTGPISADACTFTDVQFSLSLAASNIAMAIAHTKKKGPPKRGSARV